MRTIAGFLQGKRRASTFFYCWSKLGSQLFNDLDSIYLIPFFYVGAVSSPTQFWYHLNTNLLVAKNDFKVSVGMILMFFSSLHDKNMV